MSFQTIENATGKSTVQGVAVGCGPYGLAGRGYRCNIRLGKDVMEALKVTVGNRLVPALGEGEDEGWLQLRPNDLAGFKLSLTGEKSRSLVLHLTALSDNKKHPLATVNHKFIDGTLYIELPDWARAKTTKAV